MEQHPVPQNVTTFQFRLIGDMTIKQFGYLALGAIFAYICYKLPLPFFFTWPLTLFSALLGFGLAFVPVEERPMDIWIRSFIKNVYNPTQYVWQKRAAEAAAAKIPKPASPMNRGEPASTQRGELMMPAAPKPMVAPLLPKVALSSVLPGLPVSPPPARFADESRRAQETELAEIKRQLREVLDQKSRMEKELETLRTQKTQQTTPLPEPPVKPAAFVSAALPPSAPLATKPTAPQPPKGVKPNVRFLTEDNSVKAGLPKLTIFPNVVTGIIKDYIGNLLPGILVTIRDKNDIPMRALKTNKLGQFASAMPLPNGTYLVEIEDPREGRIFDRIQVTLTGKILPTLEVISKSQKQIDRDNLAKEIFGGPGVS